MDPVPDHTLKLAERLLEAYCRRICPPQSRSPVVLGWRADAAGLVLHEVRRICGVPGTARAVDVARFRWDARDAAWRLQWRDPARGAWRRHPAGPQRNLAALLRAVDLDAAGLFWPLLNGASLRWCSSRGPCADCGERYAAALGAAPCAGAAGPR